MGFAATGVRFALLLMGGGDWWELSVERNLSKGIGKVDKVGVDCLSSCSKGAAREGVDGNKGVESMGLVDDLGEDDGS